jgi:hypothetical protein
VGGARSGCRVLCEHRRRLCVSATWAFGLRRVCLRRVRLAGLCNPRRRLRRLCLSLGLRPVLSAEPPRKGEPPDGSPLEPRLQRGGDGLALLFFETRCFNEHPAAHPSLGGNHHADVGGCPRASTSRQQGWVELRGGLDEGVALPLVSCAISRRLRVLSRVCLGVQRRGNLLCVDRGDGFLRRDHHWHPRPEKAPALRGQAGKVRRTAAGYAEKVARKWWQSRWYFFLPVAVVLGIGLYFASVGRWRIAAIYFVGAAFYAALGRRRWERYGTPRDATRKEAN